MYIYIYIYTYIYIYIDACICVYIYIYIVYFAERVFPAIASTEAAHGTAIITTINIIAIITINIIAIITINRIAMITINRIAIITINRIAIIIIMAHCWHTRGCFPYRSLGVLDVGRSQVCVRESQCTPFA